MSPVVVFDLDGTLVDSATDLAAAASALVVELGGRRLTRAEVVTMVGEGAPLLVRRALTAAGLDPETSGALSRFLALYDERLLETTRLYRGVDRALQALDPLAALAVLTNKPHTPALRVLEALGVHHAFVEVIGGDGPWPRKPNPSGLQALAKHGDGRVVLVGDSPIDAETAARAAVPFVFARYGFGASQFVTPPVTPFVVDDAGSLPGVIDEALRYLVIE